MEVKTEISVLKECEWCLKNVWKRNFDLILKGSHPEIKISGSLDKTVFEPRSKGGVEMDQIEGLAVGTQRWRVFQMKDHNGQRARDRVTGGWGETKRRRRHIYGVQRPRDNVVWGVICEDGLRPSQAGSQSLLLLMLAFSKHTHICFLILFFTSPMWCRWAGCLQLTDGIRDSSYILNPHDQLMKLLKTTKWFVCVLFPGIFLPGYGEY